MLATLKKALEDLAEEVCKRFRCFNITLCVHTQGDFQMCCMLSLVAPDELGISRIRSIRFLDAYIGVLSLDRWNVGNLNKVFRLTHKTSITHLCCLSTEILWDEGCAKQNAGAHHPDLHLPDLVILFILQLETTIYTTCGKCRRPLTMPAGSKKMAVLNKGRFSYCSTCQVPCVIVCWTMLFQCSVCHHGGHHACYRNYYARYPMLDLPTSFHQEPMASDDGGVSYSARQPPVCLVWPMMHRWWLGFNRQRPSTTFEVPAMESPRGVQIRNKLRGHLCAAGCGHFCWAASIDIDDLWMSQTLPIFCSATLPLAWFGTLSQNTFEVQ